MACGTIDAGGVGGGGGAPAPASASRSLALRRVSVSLSLASRSVRVSLASSVNLASSARAQQRHRWFRLASHHACTHVFLNMYCRCRVRHKASARVQSRVTTNLGWLWRPPRPTPPPRRSVSHTTSHSPVSRPGHTRRNRMAALARQPQAIITVLVDAPYEPPLLSCRGGAGSRCLLHLRPCSPHPTAQHSRNLEQVPSTRRLLT